MLVASEFHVCARFLRMFLCKGSLSPTTMLFTDVLVPGRALPWLGEEGEYQNPVPLPIKYC